VVEGVTVADEVLEEEDVAVVRLVVEVTAPHRWDGYAIKNELIDVVNTVTSDTDLVVNDVWLIEAIRDWPHRHTVREVRAIYEKHQPTRLVEMPELTGEEE
jgi:hypothetical protein